MESVVSLQHSNSFRGTGFLVHTSPEAFLVMTCRHVVSHFKTVQVAFMGETNSYTATVEFVGTADIALLKFKPDEGCHQRIPLKFAELHTPLDCRNVQMIAYNQAPKGLGRVLYPGVFDGNISGDPKDGFIDWDYTNEQGTSGGPVLKDNGVVGVNCKRMVAVRCAVSVVCVCTTLREWLKMENSDIGIDDMLPLLAGASA